jgi:hypothetical protein
MGDSEIQANEGGEGRGEKGTGGQGRKGNSLPNSRVFVKLQVITLRS